jgi:hypothetical protein
MTLLLIDNRVLDIPFILGCLESNVTPVILDFYTETFESLSEKIPHQTITHLGILQNNDATYSLVSSFGQSILKDVETIDPKLESWTTFYLFLEFCVSRLGVSFLDIIDCASNDWDYLSQQWNIPIRYSSRPIGGNVWELDQVSLIGLYFNEDIRRYPYIFGDSQLKYEPDLQMISGLYIIDKNTYVKQTGIPKITEHKKRIGTIWSNYKSL